MEKIAAFLARHRRVLIWTAAGAAVGLVWSLTVGCASGACRMLATPWFTALYGGVLGALLSEIFRRTPEEKQDGKGGPG